MFYYNIKNFEQPICSAMNKDQPISRFRSREFGSFSWNSAIFPSTYTFPQYLLHFEHISAYSNTLNDKNRVHYAVSPTAAVTIYLNKFLEL